MILGLFLVYRWLVPTWAIFLLLGLSPLVRYIPRVAVSVETRAGSVLCGVVVMAAQLLAGASGPLLDIFFVDSKLDRHQIVATKAFTQSLGHTVKVFYFATFIAMSDIAFGSLLLAAACAPIGTYLGKQILSMLSNRNFRMASIVLTHVIGVIYLAKALAEYQ